MQVFDQLAILFCYGGQTRKRLIDRKGNMYCLEGENEEEFKDINCLIKYMAETRNLLPKHPIKVKPQQGISTRKHFKVNLPRTVCQDQTFGKLTKCQLCEIKLKPFFQGQTSAR